MNKGVFGYTKSNINSNFFNNYEPSITSFEESSSKMIQGSKTSTTFKTLNANAGNAVVGIANSVYTTNITNGILPATYQNGSNLDLENSYVFLFDTTAPFVNNYGLTTAFEQSIPHLFFYFNAGTDCATIDWGDGMIEDACNSAGHIYAKHGIYYVQIKPKGTAFGTSYYPAINYSRHDIRDGKCLGIVSWPKNGTSLLTTQFWQRCDFVPKYLPTGVTSLSMFQCSCSFKGMEDWDVSKITSFSIGSNGAMNNDLSKWVFNSGITSLASFFAGCGGFNNGDRYPATYRVNFGNPNVTFEVSAPLYAAGDRLNAWNVSNITNMSSMFQDCRFFNQNLSGWDVSKVSNFSSMFRTTTSDAGNYFNGNLSNWQLVASGTNCSNMFSAEVATTQYVEPIYAHFQGNGLNTWNTSGVTNTNAMFRNCINFNQNLSGWNTSNVTNMQDMFRNCSRFIGSGLNNWNTSKVTNMQNMFNSAGSLGSGINLNLSNWSVTGVTTMTNMFRGCSNLKNVTISGWSTKAGCSHDTQFQVANLSGSYLPNWTISGGNNCFGMFDQANLTNVSGLDSWNTIGISNMQSMFASATFNSGTSSISNWNVSNVTTMQQMFQTTAGFNQNLSSWNVSNCTNFRSMFYQNSSFNNSVSGWNFPSGTTLQDMFAGHLVPFTGNGLDSWNVTGVVNANGVFSYNPNASAISTKITDWNLCNCTDMSNIFLSTTISTGNYDNLLNAWKVKTTGNGVKNWATNLTPHFGSSKYTAAGSGSRAALVSYGWTITDGGLQV